MDTKIKQPDDTRYSSNPPENYERFFVPTIGEPLAKDLIRKAGLSTGEKVLDAGCGTGIIGRLAFKEVGEGGSVTGQDLNPGMLAVARSITKDLPIAWQECSTENMPFENETFDAVICQMALQFMENRHDALQEMHRVLVAGGRLVLNVPGPAGEPFAILAEEMKRTIGEEAGKFVDHVFVLNDIDEIRELVQNAGFNRVEVQASTKMLSLPAPKDFLWQYIYSTPLAGALAQADSEQKALLEENVVARWQEFVEENAFIYEQRVVTVRAVK